MQTNNRLDVGIESKWRKSSINMAVDKGNMSSAEGASDEHVSDEEAQEHCDYEGSESQSHSESDPEMEDSENEHGEGNEDFKNSSSDAESVSTEDEHDRLSLDENADDGGWMDAEDEGDDNMSSSDDEQPHGTHESIQPKINSNPGWADAMAKILRTTKPKGKKSIVLAKAKKLSQSSLEAKKKVENNDDPGFEIDGDVKTEDIKPKVEEMDVKPDLDKISLKAKLKRRDHLAEGRVKPSILDRERDRALTKIATKGVVQLFNAVRQQQKEINAKLAEAGGSVRREEKVMKSIDKRAFLDVLMGNARSERVEDLVQTKKEEDVNSSKDVPAASWNVLRDDFMTGGSLKNWDKAQEIKMENEDEEVLLD